MLIIFFFRIQLDIIHERNDNNNNQHIKVRTIRNLKNISTSLLHTSKKKSITE